MKNVALIFAGGTGRRMHTNGVPKQFLELYGKPIIIYTLDKFENHDEIDAIVIACLEEYIPKMKKLCAKFNITKVKSIVPGGSTGQDSIYNGLAETKKLYGDEKVQIFVHDGVRPLVDPNTISACIRKVTECGNAVTVTPAIETVMLKDGAEGVKEILKRDECMMAKAPQGFILDELLSCHERARADKIDSFIDSASMMRHYGHKLYFVEGRTENIKITTPIDYYIFKAIIGAKESSNAFGL